jgi:hypothetical protein
MRIASHSGQCGRYTLESGFDQCGLFLKPSQIGQGEVATVDFAKGMVWRVDVAEQAHNAVMQAMSEHNLVTGYFRISGCGTNMVDLACRLVDYLKCVLAHDA